jgi:hypothetical protein
VLEDRCTGLTSHVESPVCSRLEVRMKCKSRRTESRRDNEVGIKVKLMNNKERDD